MPYYQRKVEFYIGYMYMIHNYLDVILSEKNPFCLVMLYQLVLPYHIVFKGVKFRVVLDVETLEGCCCNIAEGVFVQVQQTCKCVTCRLHFL